MAEIWSDLTDKLKHDSRGAVKKVINTEAVIVSIKNILGTHPGERVMLPEFASPLRSIIFENMDKDVMDLLSREVKRVIERWDDRVSVTGVEYFQKPDDNQVTATISFMIVGDKNVYTLQQDIGGTNG